MFKGSKNAYLLIASIFITSFSSTAQVSTTPSAAQIEQIKKLPRAQQEALAKQFGVDINSFGQSSTNPANMSGQEERPEDQYLKSDNEINVDSLDIKSEKDEDLKPFGYDLFEKNQSAFLPEGQLPVPADYIVAPGDTIEVSLYGKESNQYTLTINNNGQITIPGLDPLTVSGLSYQELKVFISEIISTKMIGMKATTSIANLGGIQVYVIGDVTNPGAYYLSSLSTVTNALFISGGPSNVGSLRNIKVKRGGKVVAKVDLYELFIDGNATSDKRLQQGDVVFVPAITHQVSITGEVRRPAIYEIKPEQTIADAITMAGGLNLSAYPKNVVVASFNSNYQRDIKRIDLNDKAVTNKVKNGDVITVLPISERLGKVVNVAGAVSRPSTYAWQPDMTLSTLIASKDDLMSSTDLDYALVLTQNLNGGFAIQQFKPRDMLNGQDIKLSQGSLVVFFNRFNRETFEISTGLELNQDAGNKLDNDQQPEQEQSLTQALSSIDSEGLNYLHAIQHGNIFDKQKALVATKQLDRFQLLTPIMQVLSASYHAGKLTPIAEISGQVRFPGIYPIAHNASVTDLVAAAGGLTESANLKMGEVSRTSYDEEGDPKLEHISFNLGQAINENKSSNVSIQPKDVVNIFQQANWQEDLKVTLSGEVKYPGTYSISAGETLSNLLHRAGGLSKFAAPESAFFTRTTLKKIEQEQARALARSLSKELAFKSISTTASNINVSEVQLLVKELTQIDGVGRLIIDLPKLIAKQADDIALENGDVLHIPSFRSEVNIMGEVQVATSHLFNKEWAIDDYITSSGGLRIQSDEDRIYVIRSNGLVDATYSDSWFGIGKVDINPGDTIVVPLNSAYTDKLTLWQSATSIFYQLTVGLAAIASF
jgi:protein involved in polysaccharide export with SLBB domain